MRKRDAMPVLIKKSRAPANTKKISKKAAATKKRSKADGKWTI